MKSLCNRLARRTALLALLVGCLGAMDLETARAQVSAASTRRLLSEQFHASTRVSFARVGAASAERSAIERRLGAHPNSKKLTKIIHIITVAIYSNTELDRKKLLR